jgi:colanic acid/amylovoran biosynthesis glycosyltransferase
MIFAPRLLIEVLSPSRYGYQADSLSALYRLSSLCSQRRRYDVLHAHFGPVANSFRFARQLWKAPLVVSFHGYDFSTWPRRMGANVYSELFRVADAVTVNSEYTRRRVAELGCPEKKLELLSVGLDTRAFQYRERSPVENGTVRILTVARLVEIKGLEYAIRAIAQIIDTCPDLHYDIVGDGPLKERLANLILELDIGSKVTLHGAQPSDYVQRMMQAAHIFVLPSVTVQGDEEGQGLVLQEAQACGLPVIATQTGGLTEGLAPNESGLLVPPADATALAQGLKHLVENQELWPVMSRNGRRYVEHKYDIQVLNHQLVELYDKLSLGYRSSRDGRRTIPPEVTVT